MTTRRLFEALFAIALLVIAVRHTTDPDLWWHLRTGEYILANGIPRTDVFSFTVPDHRWVTHEWLTQVFMWLVFQAGGLTALMLVFALITALAFWLVYRRCSGRPYLAAFVVLLAAFAAAITWGARPQMFNLLLLGLFLSIVEGVRGGVLSERAFWWLPPLTALWANLHSGYLLGVVLLAVYVVGESVPRWQAGGPGLSRAAWRRLLLVTPLSFLAAVLNPNGYHLWIYPFETLGSGAMQSYIVEWRPPDLHVPIFWPFAALLAGQPLKRADPRHIRDEKVRLLRQVVPLTRDRCLLGQYTAGTLNGKAVAGYREEPGVPAGSRTATSACAVFEVRSPRWRGVPFLVSATKGAATRCTEIRMRLKSPENDLFRPLMERSGDDDHPLLDNELVIHVQPDAKIFLRIVGKRPGIGFKLDNPLLDLIYREAYAGARIGDGLYGVDLKEVKGKAFVIEVNDNPSIDAGCEDQVLGEELYLAIMASLRRRMDRRR